MLVKWSTGDVPGGPAAKTGLLPIQEPRFDPWSGNFPGGSDSKESACNAGDPGSISGWGRFPWRRERLPTLGFLPGEFHGQRSLVGCSPWGRKELDTTE